MPSWVQSQVPAVTPKHLLLSGRALPHPCRKTAEFRTSHMSTLLRQRNGESRGERTLRLKSVPLPRGGVKPTAGRLERPALTGGVAPVSLTTAAADICSEHSKTKCPADPSTSRASRASTARPPEEAGTLQAPSQPKSLLTVPQLIASVSACCARRSFQGVSRSRAGPKVRKSARADILSRVAKVPSFERRGCRLFCNNAKAAVTCTQAGTRELA